MINVTACNFSCKARIAKILVVLCIVSLLPKAANAAVGMAEKYDEFKEEDLTEFHEFLLREETDKTSASSLEEYRKARQAGTKDETVPAQEQSEEQMKTISKIKKEDEKKSEYSEEQLKFLKEQLLNLPKKDRFKMTVQSEYEFQTNVNRDDKLEEANTDSIIDAQAISEINLSGKKTDLRFEMLYGRQWNWEFSERDFYQTGSRLRYRRQYLKKLKHATQYNLTKHSSKAVEIDNNKVRWDITHRNTLNYNLSQKTALNLDSGGSKRFFTQEAFDQDSQWQVDVTPSFFWNFTPKSRVSVGYEFGASRIRSKTGDANSHTITLNYFGKITSKSSVSFDFAFEHQTPRSTDTATVNTVTTGLGYIYQLTPKTQVTTQLLRSLQNTTSNLVSGEVDGENTTSKTDEHFSNNSLTLSINSNFTRKVSGNLAFNFAQQRTEITKEGDSSDRTWQFTYPMRLKIRVAPVRWLTVNLEYTLDFRKGKKDESYKNHVFGVTTTAIF